jgi:hypothetical protein
LQDAAVRGLAAGFGKSTLVSEWTAAEVPEMQIIHGSVTINGRPGIILWTSDIQSGILSIPKKARSGERLYIRLSLTTARTQRNVN